MVRQVGIEGTKVGGEWQELGEEKKGACVCEGTGPCSGWHGEECTRREGTESHASVHECPGVGDKNVRPVHPVWKVWKGGVGQCTRWVEGECLPHAWVS